MLFLKIIPVSDLHVSRDFVVLLTVQDTILEGLMVRRLKGWNAGMFKGFSRFPKS